MESTASHLYCWWMRQHVFDIVVKKIYFRLFVSITEWQVRFSRVFTYGGCVWSCCNELCLVNVHLNRVLVMSGLKPIPYYNDDELLTIESVGKPIIQLPKTSSPNNILKSEPLLTFSFVFICLRIAIVKLPRVLYHLNNLWRSYIPHLNLEIFGETRQLMGRILHMFDIRRAWAKLRLCKTKNFHTGARNARVWASSLASVS